MYHIYAFRPDGVDDETYQTFDQACEASIKLCDAEKYDMVKIYENGILIISINMYRR